MACRICKRGSCSESFHSIAEQEAFDRRADELEDKVAALTITLEATRRTAGYLARMVRHLDVLALEYAQEILDTPEIAAALAAAEDTKGLENR